MVLIESLIHNRLLEAYVKYAAIRVSYIIPPPIVMAVSCSRTLLLVSVSITFPLLLPDVDSSSSQAVGTFTRLKQMSKS